LYQLGDFVVPSGEYSPSGPGGAKLMGQLRIPAGPAGYVLTSTGIGTAPALLPVSLTGVVDVISQYGADPTGVSDSTTAFQNAINACTLTSGVPNARTGAHYQNKVWYLGPGNFKTSGTVSIPPVTGLYMLGAGRLVTSITNTSGNDVFTTNGFQYCRIANMLITAAGAGRCFNYDYNPTTQLATWGFNQTSQEVLVENMFFSGGRIGFDAGVSGFQCDTAVLLHCFFLGQTTAGFRCINANSLGHVIISGNVQSCQVGVLNSSGSIAQIVGTNFQQSVDYDVKFSGSPGGQGQQLVGVRSESFNFVSNAGAAEISMVGCTHQSGDPRGYGYFYNGAGQATINLSNTGGLIKHTGGNISIEELTSNRMDFIDTSAMSAATDSIELRNVNYGDPNFSFVINRRRIYGVAGANSVDYSVATSPAVPGQPTNVFTSTNATTSTLPLTWTASSGSPTDYSIRYSERLSTQNQFSPSSNWQYVSVGSAATTKTLTGLDANHIYDVQIVGVNANGGSPISFNAVMTTASGLSSILAPSDISGCWIWLDASDGSTITLATGVSQWSDKSGHGLLFAQSTGSSQPTVNSAALNGLNTLRFTAGNSQSLTCSNPPSTNANMQLPLIEGQNGYAIFAVLKRAGPAGTNNVYTFNLPGGAGGINSGGLQWESSDTIIRSPDNKNASTAQATTAYCYISSRNPGGYNSSIRLNGVDVSSIVTSTNSTYLKGIGEKDAGGTFANCDIAELIVYQSSIAAVDIPLVETYLNTKWFTAPISNPTAIAGLQLWLDGGDAASQTISSGTSISQWRDKSGNVNHANQSTSAKQPTRLVADQNGLNTVNFARANSQSFDLTSNINLASGFTIACVIKIGSMLTGQMNVCGRSTDSNVFPLDWEPFQSTGYIYGSSTDSEFRTTNGIQNTGYICVMAYASATGDGAIAVNGAFAPSLHVAGLTSSQVIDEIGAYGVTYSNGDIAELAVYNTVLSGTNLLKLSQYMRTRWNV
jgi:hypothetical protein